MPGPDARGARTKVITRLQRNGFNATRVRRHGQQQIDVRSPSIALDDRLLASCANGIAYYSYTKQAEAAERIVHAGNLGEATSEPAADPLQLPNGLGHILGDGRFTDNDVRTTFESLDQLGDLFRSVGQVTLQEDDRVSTWVSAAVHCRAEKRVDRLGVADVIRPAEDRDGKGIGIRRKDFRGGIGAAVVEDEQFVFTRKVRKCLSDTPKNQTRGLGFVMNGDADV